MELALNLTWLSLSVAAMIFVLPRAMRSRRPLHVAVALACALALLFPIISVTDDLTSEPDALEQSTRRLVAASHQHDAPLMAVVATLIAAIVLTAFSMIETRVAPRYALLLTTHTDPRSPPSR